MPQLGRRNSIHFVIAVMKIKDLHQAHKARDFEVVFLIIKDHFSHRVTAAGHLVVCDPNQNALVSLADQLNDSSCGEKRNVVIVRLDGCKHLAPVRLRRLVPLDEHH
jgi:hypothetical protein